MQDTFVFKYTGTSVYFWTHFYVYFFWSTEALCKSYAAD